MRRFRPAPALAAALTLVAPLAGAAEPEIPAARERLRMARFLALDGRAEAAAEVPLHIAVRAYALALDGLTAGDSAESGYWQRAAKTRVALAKWVGTSVLDLEGRVRPSPAPLQIRADLRRSAVRLRRLGDSLGGGAGEPGYWRRANGVLATQMAEQVALLHDLVDRILAGAPGRLVPASLSVFHLGQTLLSTRPSGSGGPEYWRRAAEDQVSVSRAIGLSVAGHVRFMTGPVRRSLLFEAAALRKVRLGEVAGADGWRAEARRLGAVLQSHQSVLQLIADELQSPPGV